MRNGDHGAWQWLMLVLFIAGIAYAVIWGMTADGAL